MHQPVDAADFTRAEEAAVLEALCAQYVVSLLDKGFAADAIADAMHHAGSALDAEIHGHPAPDAVM